MKPIIRKIGTAAATAISAPGGRGGMKVGTHSFPAAVPPTLQDHFDIIRISVKLN